MCAKARLAATGSAVNRPLPSYSGAGGGPGRRPRARRPGPPRAERYVSGQWQLNRSNATLARSKFGSPVTGSIGPVKCDTEFQLVPAPTPLRIVPLKVEVKVAC